MTSNSDDYEQMDSSSMTSPHLLHNVSNDTETVDGKIVIGSVSRRLSGSDHATFGGGSEAERVPEVDSTDYK